jgi:hypothetical protein
MQPIHTRDSTWETQGMNEQDVSNEQSAMNNNHSILFTPHPNYHPPQHRNPYPVAAQR